jgi:hypothetical protein
MKSSPITPHYVYDVFDGRGHGIPMNVDARDVYDCDSLMFVQSELSSVTGIP